VDYQAASAVLTDERAKLVHQLAELGANESGDLTGDTDYGDGFADAASATAERTEVIGLVENLHERLEDVDRALERIAAGEYGRCESCGREIDADRMAFRPTSRFCVECKRKQS